MINLQVRLEKGMRSTHCSWYCLIPTRPPLTSSPVHVLGDWGDSQRGLLLVSESPVLLGLLQLIKGIWLTPHGRLQFWGRWVGREVLLSQSQLSTTRRHHLRINICILSVLFSFLLVKGCCTHVSLGCKEVPEGKYLGSSGPVKSSLIWTFPGFSSDQTKYTVLSFAFFSFLLTSDTSLSHMWTSSADVPQSPRVTPQRMSHRTPESHLKAIKFFSDCCCDFKRH